MNTASSGVETSDGLSSEQKSFLYAMMVVVAAKGYGTITKENVASNYETTCFSNRSAPYTAPNAYYSLFIGVYTALVNNPNLIGSFLDEVDPYLLAARGQNPVYKSKDGSFHFPKKQIETGSQIDILSYCKCIIGALLDHIRAKGFQHQDISVRYKLVQFGITEWANKHRIDISLKRDKKDPVITSPFK